MFIYIYIYIYTHYISDPLLVEERKATAETDVRRDSRNWVSDSHMPVSCSKTSRSMYVYK